ncbi:hypothetical protein EPN18_06885 [bacterium]|nr:MAG: hypothetical protein EPN18_06885 [bacterium]
MIDIASHKFSQKDNCADADNEVERLYTWLKRNTEKIEKSERPITYRYLGKILKKFGFELKDRYKGYTGVYRMKDSVRIAHIPCSGDGVQVGREVLRTVREECKLTEAHGCDSRLFYEEGEVINFFINKYRKTLDKLSKV